MQKTARLTCANSSQLYGNLTFLISRQTGRTTFERINQRDHGRGSYESRSLSTTPRVKDNGTPNSNASNRAAIDELSTLLDASLDMTNDNNATPARRPSHFQSPRAQQERKPENQAQERGQANRGGPQNSGDLAQAPDARRPPDQSKSPQTMTSIANMLKNVPPRRKDKSRMVPGAMDDPRSNISNALDPKGRSNLPAAKEQQVSYPLPVRLGPSIGKTVRVDQARNIDVGKAFRQLDQLVKRNMIRSEFNKQKFHERPGLRKKRLKMERWRRTFLGGFKGMIAMVKKMKKQGW